MIWTPRQPTDPGVRAAPAVSPLLATGVVTRSEEIAPDVAVLAFRAPEIAARHFPGRFVHLKTGDGSTLLRRPFCLAGCFGQEARKDHVRDPLKP